MNNSIVLTIIVLAVVAVVGAAVALRLRNRDSERLRARFGTEYDRVVEDVSGRKKLAAETDLKRLEKRVDAAAIRPLTPGDRDRYLAAWVGVQARFVDDPKRSVGEADALLGEVMSTRGYPIGDFEQRAADVSVDHPQVVANYRTAHAIALRPDEGPNPTEDLRQAMILYRSLFDDLVGAPEPSAAKAAL